jgi:hypothetical protein
MKFRLKALGLHLLASATVLTLVLGSLYFGWYRWPGWYLTEVTEVVMVMIGVDIVLGPLLTFVVAGTTKPRSVLKRDIAVIVSVQLCALIYGATSLWNGRPLYYAFSPPVIQLVQAYDISADDAAIGRTQNPEFAPHWYSLPRWTWATLPQDVLDRDKINHVSVAEDDPISLPKYFKPWDQGLPSLRSQLRKIDKVAYFAPGDKKAIKERMQALGMSSDESNAIPFIGRGKPLLAVFDLKTMKMTHLFTRRPPGAPTH